VEKTIGKITLAINYANVTYNKNEAMGNQYGWFFGGIIGIMRGGEVTKCVNYGDITGTHSVGGIVGDLYERSGSVSLCGNHGYIKGDEPGETNLMVGGIIGNIFRNNDDEASEVIIENSYNVGTVESTASMETEAGKRGHIGGVATFVRR